jgi:hypothetical protein
VRISRAGVLVADPGEQLDGAVASGEVRGLDKTGPDGLLQRLFVAGGKAAQLRDGCVVIKGLDGQHHRSRSQSVG